MAYTLTTTYDNPPSAVVTLTWDGGVFPTRSLYRFKVYSDSEGTQLVTESGWITLSETTNTITYTIASIAPGTYYITAESDDPLTFVSLQQTVLVDNTPKTATVSQWEDLAARVKAKADASSIPTVNNSTITVTNNGLDKGTFTTNQATAGTVALDYPTITMTTTDPGEGAAISANNYVAVYGGDPIIMDYSTSEINTGAKWVDGTAIYKKTFNTGALPNTTTKNVAHNISNLDSVIKIEGWAYSSSAGFHFPLPYVSSGQVNECIGVYVDNSNIVIKAGVDRTAFASYITLYYTKSS